jgi:ubiquinone/menaquinone biosynthesis C-methylase UbiE
MADNLRAVFNTIAPGWYNFRHHTIFRREMETLAAGWRGGRLLNIGCGHGADFLPFTARFELYGLDFSVEMLRLAQKYAEKFRFSVDFTMADAVALPFRDDSFDYAIAVATYHHLETNDRLPALLELKRVLKPGGEAFITVWNRWQPRFWLSRREILVPWRTKEQTFYRYYNLFSYHAMARLVKQAGFELVRLFPENGYRFPIGFFSRNVCAVIKKRSVVLESSR